MGRVTTTQVNELLARLRKVFTTSGLTEEDFAEFLKNPETVQKTLAAMRTRLVADVGSSVGINSLILSGKRSVTAWSELLEIPWVHVSQEDISLVEKIPAFGGSLLPVKVAEAPICHTDVVRYETPQPIFAQLGERKPVHPIFLLRYLNAWPSRFSSSRGREWLCTLVLIEGAWNIAYLYFSDNGNTLFRVVPIKGYQWGLKESILVTER